VTDPTPTPSGTGNGGVSPVAFWSAIITLLGSTIILPMWQMWLSNQHEINRAEQAKATTVAVAKVLDNQEQTHEAIKEVSMKQTEAAEKVEEVKAATNVLVDKVDTAKGNK